MAPAQPPRLGSATLHEAADQIGVLPHVIKPVGPGFRIWGPAFPVRCSAGSNLWLHRALYAAPKGAVLVASVEGAHDFGYWGEILSVAAAERGLGGLVLDGCARDADQVAEIGFPVFSRGLCIRGTGKAAGGGGLGGPVTIGGVVVCPEDLVVGDADGVVVIPRGRADQVIAAGQAREDKEAAIMKRLRAGERTIDIYELA